MNRKQYEAKRLSLMNEAQTLLDAGKVEEANAKMEEVKSLDAKWDEIAQATANLNALTREPEPVIKVNEGVLPGREPDTPNNPMEAALRSDVYKYAWAKTLMGRPLNAKEKEVYDQVNAAFTGTMTNDVHTTQNTGIVIPETVTKGIWEMVGERYPYFEDITKTYVNGILTMIQEETSTEAGWYDEDTPTADGKETFKKYTLSGCELSRVIRVSWKLKEMAIDEFIPYIQRKMARKMGAAVGYGVTHGKGNANESKREPIGVVTALLAENETPRVVTYTGVPAYGDIIKARAKVASGYSNGLKIYANNSTIWNKIAMILDANGRPIFVADPMSGGVHRLLGIEVKEEASMEDGEILFSNASEGYQANINKEFTMMTEDHVTDRVTDYAGYAIIDGNVITLEAHVLLKENASMDVLAAGVPTAVKVSAGVTDAAVEAGAEAAEAVTEDTAATKKSTAKKES